jgi:hypothetical protein
MKPEDVDLEKIKAHFGGSLPVCNGKKYRYPTTEEGWRVLFAKALNYQTKIRNGRSMKRNYKFEYILYHARDAERARRSKRNKDRKVMRENGHDVDGKEVHHLDAKNLSRPVVVTRKEHDRLHAKDDDSGEDSSKAKKKAKKEKMSRKQ